MPSAFHCCRIYDCRKKGLNNLIQLSGIRGNDILENYFSDAARSEPDLVHASCMKTYTDTGYD